MKRSDSSRTPFSSLLNKTLKSKNYKPSAFRDCMGEQISILAKLPNLGEQSRKRMGKLRCKVE